MRIITGTLKSRKLVLPKGVETRPTTDRTKESIFNILEVRKGLEDASVLDLFSGSGNLAIEAISRGAQKAVCVENNKKCSTSIEKNVEAFGIKDQVKTITADVWGFINGFASPYDIVFADPPYDYPYMTELANQVISGGWLKEDGWFVLEHDLRHNFSTHPHCVFSKAYGRTIVTIFLKHAVHTESDSIEV